MTTPRNWRRFPALPLALLALLAQSIYGQGDSVSQDEEDDVFTLSPFQVSAADNTGYRASSTLAGTRIKSDLRDIGASISVVTEGFLQDTGSTGSDELLVYTTGTETGGVIGNFSAAEIGGGSNGESTTQGLLSSPQFATRVRGLLAPDLTRDYFLTSIPFDSYNTTRVEINRGANAILFGLGSPAGILNNSTIQPYFRNGGEVEVRIDDEGSFRAAFDYNHVVFEDRLAVRVAALYDDREFQQKPAFEEDTRYHIGATWKVTDSTTLRINSENGKIDANRPDPVAPGESVSGWILSNNPVYDLNAGHLQANVGPNPNTDDYILDRPFTEGGTVNATLRPNFSLDLGGGQILNTSEARGRAPVVPARVFARQTATVRNSVSSRFPDTTMDQVIWTQLPDPTQFTPHPLDVDAGRDNYQFRTTRDISQMYGPGWVMPSLMDDRVFDWVNNLLSGDSAFQNSEFETFNVGLEQTFLEEKAGFELVYDQQRYEQDNFNPLQDQTGVIWLDINPVLPVTENGLAQPNPNFMRPFVATRLNNNKLDEDRDAFRATGFFEHDFGQNSDSWWANALGRHVLTGVFNSQEIEELSRGFRGNWHHPAMLRQANTQNVNSFNPGVQNFIYVGPPVDPGATSMDAFTVNRLDGAELWSPGAPFPGVVWDGGSAVGSDGTRHADGRNAADAQAILDKAGPDGLGSITANDDFTFFGDLNGVNWRKDEIDSTAFNWQAFLFDGLLVPTIGWREDEVALKQFGTGDIPTDNLGVLQLAGVDIEDAMQQEASSETWTYSGVAYWPNNFVELPFKSDLSIHYSQSENFQPALGRINVRGEALPSPAGETEEYGFTISSFANKLSLRVNWYETIVGNRSFGLPSGSIGNGIYQWTNFWAGNARSAEGTGPEFDAAAELMDTTIDWYLDQTPQEILDTYSVSVDRTPDGKPQEVLRIFPSGLTDTADNVAEGVEFELVYNPTQNWRIIANLSQTEAVQSNIAPMSEEEVDRINSLFAQKIPGTDVTLGEAPRSWGGPFLPNETGRARFGEDFANNPSAETLQEWWDNTVVTPLNTAQALDGSSNPEVREWRFNLVTNYSFTEGRFKGLGVGGGVRYQSEAAIGFPLIDTDGDGTPDTGDVNTVFETGTETNYDAWVSYRLPFFENQGDWDLQLNVRNIFASDDDVIPIRSQNNGMPAQLRFAPQRQIFLTSRFAF